MNELYFERKDFSRSMIKKIRHPLRCVLDSLVLHIFNRRIEIKDSFKMGNVQKHYFQSSFHHQNVSIDFELEIQRHRIVHS